MWVLTQSGFFSVVAYDPAKDRHDRGTEGDLLVRSRVKEDLESLRRWVPRIEIHRDDTADYLFRAVITRQEWLEALAGEVGQIDYDNFKNRVRDRQGRERHDIYSRVWSDLHTLQTRERRPE